MIPEKLEYEELLEGIVEAIDSCRTLSEQITNARNIYDNCEKLRALGAEFDYVVVRERLEQLLKTRELVRQKLENSRKKSLDTELVDIALLLGFDWTEPEPRPVSRVLDRARQIAYDFNKNNPWYPVESGYETAKITLQDIGQEGSVEVLDSCLFWLEKFYRPAREICDICGSEEEKLEALRKGRLYYEGVNRKFLEVNYYFDSLMKGDTVDKKKAADFFAGIGADKSWDESQLESFAAQKLKEIQTLRDTTTLAVQDSVAYARKQDESSPEIEKQMAYFDGLRTVSDKLEDYQKRFRKLVLSEPSEEEVDAFAEEVRREFPLEPYRTFVSMIE
ncbi:hypothetical protein KY336_01175 [Candidatus Woesearchaeota archaeon]|nr:hypothetical protein [Candidatus Woesearchaeota archaeon]